MKLYHKIFKRRSDLSIYLDNPDQLVAYAEEMLNRLTHAKSVDELHKAKLSVLKDFCDIYAFDVSNAEFPEPVGHFDNEEEKSNFIKRKIFKKLNNNIKKHITKYITCLKDRYPPKIFSSLLISYGILKALMFNLLLDFQYYWLQC